MSHDPSLERCFGIKKKVTDCDWEYLSTLTTIDEPKDRMPRLVDLLEFLDQKGLEDIWVLLDIKVLSSIYSKHERRLCLTVSCIA